MSQLHDPQVRAALDAVEARYVARIQAVLERLAAAFRHAGLTTAGPAELAIDGSPSWSIVARVPRAKGERQTIDVIFEIACAAEYGGEPADGLNFGLRTNLWGGQPLITLEPFNFTPAVWVSARDAAAVEARFRLVEGVEAGAFVADARAEAARLLARR